MADDKLESTASLLVRAQTGDKRAQNVLMDRFRPALRRMAHGRLPRGVGGAKDTDDIVQDTLLRAFHHLEGFKRQGDGAFLGWLRQILLNRLVDEGRADGRRPPMTSIGDDHPDHRRTPIEILIGREAVETYEKALSQLSEDHRNAIIMRFDFDYSYEELAEALGRKTKDAARMLAVRAVMRLAELMGEPS